eukprot:CAMPEP_0183706904 /NCGR_PEP_ID=MMETSP0737-20130205/3617_1 /TAXON_ID=385413 /ORGANISM="Thalassiosira miniscula, Strain CCMP1093" /LENGTH=861 /DNA_ID=CAMNT_0025934441 /DNA_START=289 /DNA_END=2870 /DNA_ORIENTATION=+
MKVALLTLAVTLGRFSRTMADNHGDDPHSYCVGGANGPSERPLLDLTEAYAPLRVPEQIYPDENGLTEVTLLYGLKDYNGPSFSSILRGFNGGAPGPTIHAVPGGKVKVKLVNCFENPIGSEHVNKYQKPNATNLHTHGPHVGGRVPGDNVFRQANPGELLDYEYDILSNHMPGTFWYHPHIHGSTALQVGQGAAGMLIIDDPEDYEIPDQIKDMEQIQLVFQHMDLDILRDASMISGDDVTDWRTKNFEITNKTTDLTNLMLVNMQFLPKLTMTAGKWYRWRMVVSSIRAALGFISQSGNCEFKLLAKDGMYINDAPRDVEAVLLASGNRADVAVRCNEPGMEKIDTTFVDLLCRITFPDGTVSAGTNYGCFEPSKQYRTTRDGHEAEEDPPVTAMVGEFMDPKHQPTIMVIDVVSPPEDEVVIEDIESFKAPTPCYLVDLTGLSDDEVNGKFVNRYHCENPPPEERELSGGPAWPVIVTPHDVCGIYGPYGVGYEGGLEDEMCEEAYPGQGDCPFIPWVDTNSFINDFEVGSVQELEILSVTFHPYHQHINSFQIVELDTRKIPDLNISDYTANWYQVGDWQDTLQYPVALSMTGNPNGNFNPGESPLMPHGPHQFFGVKVRFQADLYTGSMVQHCHLLYHEDQGMMTQYNVTGKEGTVWAGARKIDPTCVLPSEAELSPPTTTKEGCVGLENEMEVRDGAIFHYTLHEDALEGCLHVPDHGGWAAIGFSANGKMVASEGITHNAVIGWAAGQGAMKYDLTSQAALPEASASQTLEGASYESVEGDAVLKFTKKLEEEGEVPITADGVNFFLYAWGDRAVNQGFHSAYGSLEKNFADDTVGDPEPEPDVDPEPEPDVDP